MLEKKAEIIETLDQDEEEHANKHYNGKFDELLQELSNFIITE
jgi:hypothetical protein